MNVLRFILITYLPNQSESRSTRDGSVSHFKASSKGHVLGRRQTECDGYSRGHRGLQTALSC